MAVSRESLQYEGFGKIVRFMFVGSGGELFFVVGGGEGSPKSRYL